MRVSWLLVGATLSCSLVAKGQCNDDQFLSLATPALGFSPDHIAAASASGWKLSPTCGLHLGLDAGYMTDYWFRYQNRGPNLPNVQGRATLSLDWRDVGTFYGSVFTESAFGARSRYYDAFLAGQNVYPNVSDNFEPQNDFQELDLTAGFGRHFFDVLQLDLGWTGFITPANQYVFTPKTGLVNPIEVVGMPPSSYFIKTVTADGFAQEVFFRAGLDDSKWLGAFAVHPYIFVGFDYDGNYVHGAGQYFEFGLSHTYEIPQTYGLTLTPYGSISAIHDEKLMDRSQRMIRNGGGVDATRDGYLGTSFGVNAVYPLNHWIGISERYGTISIVGSLEFIFAGTSFSQPAGSSRDDVVGGARLQWSY